MGELHAPEPLIICTDRRGSFLVGDSRACSAGEYDDLLPQEWFPEQCPSFSWGVYLHCIIDCFCTFQTGSGRQLFLSRHNYRGRWPFRLLSLCTALGQLDHVWVGGRIENWGLQREISIACPGSAPVRVPCQQEALCHQQCPELLNSSEWFSQSPATMPDESRRPWGCFLCCDQWILLWVSGLPFDKIVSTWPCSRDAPIWNEPWSRHH